MDTIYQKIEREDHRKEEVTKELHGHINQLMKGCGKFKGDLAVRCFAEVNDFKDDLLETFKEEGVDVSDID